MEEGTINKGSAPVVGFGLRHMFVAMLFAFAIENLFSKTYDHLIGENLHWLKFISAFMHVILMLILIVSSWVKWSATFSNRNNDCCCKKRKDNKLLVVDVLILFSYFVLISLIGNKIIYILLVNSIIYILYFLWDCIEYEESYESYDISLFFSLLSIFLYSSEYFVEGNSEYCCYLLLILSIVSYRFWKEERGKRKEKREKRKS